ncbi:hypothetical protein C1646_762838 [Rhizophagus diaphanus]|nr:hypothetical protein C1646_762838 [Rhizophagus diaphanus] [Rhizophagus sp. MUCL 43196]
MTSTNTSFKEIYNLLLYLKENIIIIQKEFVIIGCIAVCVITKSLARKLRLEITKPSNTIVVTADGTRNRALGQIEIVCICIYTDGNYTTYNSI